MSRRELSPQDRLRRAMDTLRWTMADLADAADTSPSTVRRWINAEYEMPMPLLAWIEDLARYVGARPAPPKPSPRESWL